MTGEVNTSQSGDSDALVVGSVRSAGAEFAQVASLLLAVCYGIAWLVITAVYRAVGVQPEDVGVDAEYLLVRAGVAATVVLIMVGGIFMPVNFFNWMRRGRYGDLTPFHSLAVLSHLFLFTVGLVLARYFLRAWSEGEPSWLASITIAVTVAVISLGLFLRAVGYRALTPLGPTLGERISIKHSLLLAAIWMASVLGGAVAAGSILGGRIAAGTPTRLVFVDARRVVILDNSHSVKLACGLRLGESSGFVRVLITDGGVIYDEGMRLLAETTAVRELEGSESDQGESRAGRDSLVIALPVDNTTLLEVSQEGSRCPQLTPS